MFLFSLFESPQLTLALSSLSKNWVPNVSLKPVFTPSQFLQLIGQVTHLPLHLLYKNAFLLGFLCMLHFLNVAPASRASFDRLRHMRRGDIIVVKNSIIINLRWTKTLQRYRQSARVWLFSILGSPICSVAAFLALQCSFPVLPTDPLLAYRASGQLFLITQSQLRRALKRSVLLLGLSPPLTFHSFRRSAASLAFASGIPFQSIQAHGTWSSDSLWAYIDADARDSSVARLFSSVFSSI
jgi:integrase